MSPDPVFRGLRERHQLWRSLLILVLIFSLSSEDEDKEQDKDQDLPLQRRRKRGGQSPPFLGLLIRHFCTGGRQGAEALAEAVCVGLGHGFDSRGEPLREPLRDGHFVLRLFVFVQRCAA